MSCMGMEFRYECARANTREGRKGGKCHCAKLSHRCASVLRSWQWICSSLRLWVYTLAWSVRTYRWCEAAKVGKCRLLSHCEIKWSFVSSQHFHRITQSKFLGSNDSSQETNKLWSAVWVMLVIKPWLPLGHGSFRVLSSSNFSPVFIHLYFYIF
jgi:hypothetical protein